jgi:hypothetical protein
MKKQLFKVTLGIALLSAVAGFSQDKTIQPCVTVDAMEEYFTANPDARVRFNTSQAELQKNILQIMAEQNAGKAAAAPVYTIPVVFHILHLGGPENISDQVAIDALKQVNTDFAAAGTDFTTIFAPFQALYINSDIKFMLAKKDPNGNCTNGIEHIYDARTVWDRNPPSSASNPALFNGIVWPATKYLNIIIVKEIVAAPNQNGTVVGYTFLPGTFSPNGVADAIVYNYGFLTGLNARSLSHEVGHWLSLIHTFGNTNNPGVVCGSTAGGDQVSDTPDTKGNFSTCPLSSTNTAFTCTSPNPTNTANYYQNVENFMDYSSCPKNFTTGQTNRMRAALAAAAGGRNNLSTPANLIATDVDGIGTCAPVAEFLPFYNSTITFSVCSGGSLNMKDFSYNGTISSYQWAADNGAVIANPTASLTSVNFPTPGITTITLTVNNGQGSSTKIKTINVANGTAIITANYFESFENSGVPANWAVTNVGNDAVTWAQTTVAAKDGSGSYFLDGTQATVSQQDILTMPVMDVVNNPNNILTFAYAYAKQTATHNDKLVFQGSLDCGGTWTDVVNLSASTMAAGSGGTTSTPFVPGSSQWKTVDVTTYPYWFNFANTQSALFRFVFTEDATTGLGNRLFLDAVDFGNPNGLNEIAKNYKLNLFPNPSNGAATIKFNLNESATVTVNVVDMLGKDVLPATVSNYNAGEQAITVNNNSSLSKGIYFVNISINGSKMAKKLVIN